jgi:hypothetical protein
VKASIMALFEQRQFQIVQLTSSFGPTWQPTTERAGVRR